jgi:uridine kinase
LKIMSQRDDVLRALAQRILDLQVDHPTRVAIDGCSAAGKTTLTDELAGVVAELTTREVIRVGIDFFKRAVDRRTGYPPGTPESYYFEMFDVPAIRDELLLPLGPGGSRRYRTEIMDLRGQVPIDSGTRYAAEDAILLADGAFLQKPALDPDWDLRIYIDVDLADVLRRGTARDQAWMDSAERAAERYRTYYIPGEQRYLDEVRPAERADIVVDNRDFAFPRIIRSRS